jgi:hypothetical protein
MHFATRREGDIHWVEKGTECHISAGKQPLISAIYNALHDSETLLSGQKIKASHD